MMQAIFEFQRRFPELLIQIHRDPGCPATTIHFSLERPNKRIHKAITVKDGQLSTNAVMARWIEQVQNEFLHLEKQDEQV